MSQAALLAFFSAARVWRIAASASTWSSSPSSPQVVDQPVQVQLRGGQQVAELLHRIGGAGAVTWIRFRLVQ